MDNLSNNPEFIKVQNELRALKRLHILYLIAFLLIAGYWAYCRIKTTEHTTSFDRLYANEIIIKDKNGNDRIIISPQISSGSSRVRKDTLEGILIMDEKGVDRVVLGATPTILSRDKIVGRVENDFPYGFVFNDSKGNERGGFGYYAGRGLVSFGMDNAFGEGLTMFVADKDFYGQKVGLVMNGDDGGQRVYMGANNIGETMLNLDTPAKGRFSISIDSLATGKIKHFDYQTESEKTLLESNK